MMKILSAAFLSTMLLNVTTANALECVVLNKPVFGTVTKVPTENGYMVVVYPVNKKLPIQTIRLTDGTRVTGAVPGNIPLSFLYADKTSTVQAVGQIVIQYVSQPNSPPGKLERYDGQHNLVATETFLPFQPYQAATYFSLPSFNVVTSDYTIPKMLALQVCVQPVASTGMTLRQVLRRNRR